MHLCKTLQMHSMHPHNSTNECTCSSFFLISCIWMLKSVCTLELMSVWDMINMILMFLLRSSTGVPFYCLLSQRLKSLFAAFSSYDENMWNHWDLYRQIWQLLIFFLTWTVRYKSTLRHSFQECVRTRMCWGRRRSISIIILFVRCDLNCLVLFSNIHNLWLFS